MKILYKIGLNTIWLTLLAMCVALFVYETVNGSSSMCNCYQNTKCITDIAILFVCVFSFVCILVSLFFTLVQPHWMATQQNADVFDDCKWLDQCNKKLNGKMAARKINKYAVALHIAHSWVFSETVNFVLHLYVQETLCGTQQMELLPDDTAENISDTLSSALIEDYDKNGPQSTLFNVLKTYDDFVAAQERWSTADS